MFLRISWDQRDSHLFTNMCIPQAIAFLSEKYSLGREWRESLVSSKKNQVQVNLCLCVCMLNVVPEEKKRAYVLVLRPIPIGKYMR